MGAGTCRWGVLVLALTWSGCGPAVTAPPPEVVPAATPKPAPPVAAAPSVKPSAPGSPEGGTMLHPWLLIDSPWGGGFVGVFELDRSMVVVVPAAGQGTARRAFVVDRESIVEEPRIVRTLPAGRVVSLRGDWPRRARIVMDVDPAGHNCTRSFEWKGRSWVEDPCGAACCSEGQPPLQWYDPEGGVPRHYRTAWAGGRSLWETYEHDSGRSTFYDDHNGKVRAKIQRARCSTGTASRLRGRFSGTVLPSGAVIAIAPDCQTGVASVERWAPGADRSAVRPLPEQVEMMQLSPMADAASAWYNVLGADDLYVTFAEDTGAELPRPYVAHFDGSTWRRLAFAEHSRPFGLHPLRDGSLWLATHDSDRWQLWRHPGAGRGGGWTDETPTGIITDGGEEFYETRLGPEGRLWFLGIDALGVRTDEGWSIYRMPLADPKQGSMPLVRPQAVHRAPWSEPVVSGYDGRRFLLFRPVRRPGGPLR